MSKNVIKRCIVGLIALALVITSIPFGMNRVKASNDTIETGSKIYIYYKENSSSSSGYSLRLVSEKTKASMSGWTAGNNQGIASWTGSGEEQDGFVPLYEVYNPINDDYYYSLDEGEVQLLVTIGWVKTGVLTYVPESGEPVYKVYNPNNGMHYNTPYESTKNELISYGWCDEGVVWNALSKQSQDPDSIPDKLKGKTDGDESQSITISARYTDQYGAVREREYTTTEQDLNKIFGDLVNEKFPEKKEGIDWTISYSSYSYETASKMTVSSIISNLKGGNTIYLSAVDEGQSDSIEPGSNVYVYFRQDSASLSGYAYRLVTEKTKSSMSGWTAGNNQGIASWTGSEESQDGLVPIYELFNPTNLEYVYTLNENEVAYLIACGWTKTGVLTYVLETGDNPIYRAYNPEKGTHYYTPYESTKNELISYGWSDEGVVWNALSKQSQDPDSIPDEFIGKKVDPTPTPEPEPELEPEPEPTPDPEPTPVPTPSGDNVDYVDEESGTAVVNNEFTGEKDTVDISIIEQSDIYRMYNPATAEHLYTKDAGEVEWLKSLGWNHETESDYTVVDARDDDAIPVYRLYNPYTDTHHFTESVDEVRYDVSVGWIYERISHYVYDKNSTKGTPQWRLYEASGAHNWTSDQGEISWLESMGWINEGIRWRVL